MNENMFGLTPIQQQAAAFGISVEQARALNFEVHRRQMALQYEYERRNIALHFAYQRRQLLSTSSTNIPAPDASLKYDFDNELQNFVVENSILTSYTRGNRNGIVFYIFDTAKNCFVQLSQEDIEQEMREFLFEKYHDAFAIASHANQAIKRALMFIPRIEKSQITAMPENVVFLQNGTFDFSTRAFSKNIQREIFRRYSIPADFPDDDIEPKAFNQLLDDMFDKDPLKIKLAYQIIGAILSEKKTLKKIFLFQGKSNGGKTRLSNIIMDLVGDEHVRLKTDIAAITSEEIDKYSQTEKLIFFREMPEKALSSKQVAALKAFAEGSHHRQAVSFKILLNANYAIKTERTGEIDRGLLNRILVLPFSKEMDNTAPAVMAFEDEFLEKERPFIVQKALLAFSDYFSENKFCAEFPLNDTLENKVQITTENGNSASQVAYVALELKRYFVLSDEHNMTADEIIEHMREVAPNVNIHKQALGKYLKNAWPNIPSPRRVDNKSIYGLSPIL